MYQALAADQTTPLAAQAGRAQQTTDVIERQD